ncbi:hypothetical protein K438DRAFT_1966270 [Mycena galopus ATCC 62051]|nr:hypothetical protein K438DRAFT_1966270 [Mycena galopus ATCC 62051]
MDSVIPFTTSGSMADFVDRKILIVLRDKRTLEGVLRSYDQFANLVLQDAVERIYVGSEFAGEYRGVVMIRRENVVLMGEIDLDREDDVLQGRLVGYADLEPYHKKDVAVKKQLDEAKAQILYEKGGFSREGEGDGY